MILCNQNLISTSANRRIFYNSRTYSFYSRCGILRNLDPEIGFPVPYLSAETAKIDDEEFRIFKGLCSVDREHSTKQSRL